MKKIKSIEYVGNEFCYCFTVGTSGITKIEPATKKGEMALITYYQIWKGDKILYAELHHYSLITYFEETQSEAGD